MYLLITTLVNDTNLSTAVFQYHVNILIIFKEAMELHNIFLLQITLQFHFSVYLEVHII